MNKGERGNVEREFIGDAKYNVISARVSSLNAAAPAAFCEPSLSREASAIKAEITLRVGSMFSPIYFYAVSPAIG
jgi:hypothetical protein